MRHITGISCHQLLFSSLESTISPFTKALEDQHLPKVRFEAALLELLNY